VERAGAALGGGLRQPAFARAGTAQEQRLGCDHLAFVSAGF
jgi:hypothetical protein